jgi:hypothetical protein
LRYDGRRADREACDAEPDDILCDGGRAQRRGDASEQSDDQLAPLEDVAERNEEQKASGVSDLRCGRDEADATVENAEKSARSREAAVDCSRDSRPQRRR